jgi:hypothetical protein
MPGTSSEISTTSSTRSMPFRLLSGFMVLTKNTEAIKLLTNVQTAAMHLACMLTNRGSIKELVSIHLCNQCIPVLITYSSLRRPFPIYPLSVIIGRYIFFSCGFDHGVLIHTETKGCGRYTNQGGKRFLGRVHSISADPQDPPRSLRRPSLFSVVPSVTKKVDQQCLGPSEDGKGTSQHPLSSTALSNNILQLSKALGNRKPPILVRIERLLWECVLRIATGKAEVFSALPDFFSKVPWDELDMISEVDQAHFADGKHIPESHYSKALIKHSRCNTAKFG